MRKSSIALIAINILVPIARYEFAKEQLAKSGYSSEFLWVQAVIIKTTPTKLLQFDSERVDGLEGCAIAINKLIRDAQDDDIPQVEAGEFTEIIEQKSDVPLPDSFRRQLLGSQMTKRGLSPQPNQKLLDDVSLQLEMTDDRRVTITCPQDASDGKIELSISNKGKWASAVWAPVTALGGRATNRMISLEVVANDQRDSVLLFGVTEETFFVYEFDLDTGIMTGAFIPKYYSNKDRPSRDHR